MKIAFITFEYPPFIIGGGAGIYAQKITRELVNLGHEVVVFTPQVITIHHLVKDAIRNNNLDLISRVRDISGENSLFIPYIEKRCLHSADKVIAVSNFTKKQITKNYKINPSKVEVVYNGIDLDGYAFTQKELRETKKQLNLPEKPVILFVGRVDDPRKGLDLLLRALKKVLERVEAVLLVVGKGDQTEVRKLANSLGISRNVIFAGFIDDATLKKCYALCDMYVCPSRLEGFGLTVLEAMAAGKPVIATKAGAVLELVKNGENGILVELNDIDGISNTICTFLQDKRLMKNAGRRNTNYVKEKFSWEKSAKEIEQLYIGLTGVQDV